MKPLGSLEAEILDRLWTWRRPATVRELVDDLNLVRPVAYTTVKTVAEILARKGILHRVKRGRVWLYEAVLTREQHTATLMLNVLGTSRDRSAALAQFLRQSTADDVTAIKALLREHDAEAER
ncbi:MAG: BlaI/MecI/CopY family transcriptional regulator [Catenulispora sp.]|nr:BlaI/MecI/CopY family transcriptional regulator [Catenulispora sp.]NUR61021.1 BlaI/MecI/CopY family transcriptional regulator [Catenulispora sp.]